MLLLFVIPQHYIKRDLKGFNNDYARAILYLVSQKASDTDSKFESSSIIVDL